MYVYVLRFMCLKLLLIDVFESLICCLNPWLSCMLNCIHICVFPFLKNWFYAIPTPPRHLAICRALKLFLIAISTLPRQLGGSIKKVHGSSIASRQLVDRSNFFSYLCCFVPRHLLDNCICRRFKLSTPFLIDVSTPLDTFICRDLLNLYI